MNTRQMHVARTEWVLVGLSYLLFVLLVTAPIGFLLSFVESRLYRRRYRGDMPAAIRRVYSHHEWLVRTFLFCGALMLVGIGTTYYFFGWVILAFTTVWFVYRLGRGLLNMLESQPAPVA